MGVHPEDVFENIAGPRRCCRERNRQEPRLLPYGLVAKVEAMLEAKKQLAQAQTDKDKTYYENKCAALDRQIDRLVYDLYGLTEEEILIVEDAVK